MKNNKKTRNNYLNIFLFIFNSFSKFILVLFYFRNREESNLQGLPQTISNRINLPVKTIP